MKQREIRIPITSLKEYLQKVGVPVSQLAELSGITISHLHKCLTGEVDYRTGEMRTMSDENLERLQDSLHQLSQKLKYIFIFYNTDLEVVKQGGRHYCPDCVEQIREQLSPIINVMPFMQYSLGWNRSKVRNVLNNHSIVYGNITQDDVNRINLKLAELSTKFDLFKLVKE